jgi:hypothetical protein
MPEANFPESFTRTGSISTASTLRAVEHGHLVSVRRRRPA